MQMNTKVLNVRISDYTYRKLHELFPEKGERAITLRAWLDQLIALKDMELKAAAAKEEKDDEPGI